MVAIVTSAPSFLITAALGFLLTPMENDPPIIETNRGPVQGLIKQYHEQNVFQYIGIPFAAPPVGDLRFEKPRSPDRWPDVLHTTQFSSSCTQYLLSNDAWLLPNISVSEDCLYLNVYIPRSVNVTAKRAVMVWIHGGGFTTGQASLFDGSYLALEGDVIVVTFNYRLGLLGFLSTEDNIIRGNYGLWDQVMAIDWVQQNIARFGGDPQNVCIFGESAGGYSVGLHTVILQNKGKFRRAISQSGALLSPRALATNSRRVAKALASLLNCSTDNDKMLSCLKSKSANAILEKQDQAGYEWDSGEENFENRIGPVLDHDLIVGDPEDLLKTATSESYILFKSIDIMAGTNNAEGGLLYFRLIRQQQTYNFNISEGIPAEVVCSVVAPAISRTYYNGSKEVTQAICNKYTVQSGSLKQQGRTALDIYGDFQFIVPTLKTLLAHSSNQADVVHKSGISYQYIFTHQPLFTWIQDRPPWLQGANHAGELPFVFGLDAMYPQNKTKTTTELHLSKQMMHYWSNFAKTGNPNSVHNNTGLPTWQPFNRFQRYYMNLTEFPRSGENLYKERMNFWLELVPHSTN